MLICYVSKSNIQFTSTKYHVLCFILIVYVILLPLFYLYFTSTLLLLNLYKSWWQYDTGLTSLSCMWILVIKWQSEWQRFVSLSLHKSLIINEISVKVTKWHYNLKNVFHLSIHHYIFFVIRRYINKYAVYIWYV